MKKIIIALSSTLIEDGGVKVNEAYLDTIYGAGAIPMLLSPRIDDEYIQNVCETVDGFLFCGGDDIDPKYYGEEKSPLIGNICSKRDKFECALFNAAYKTGKPILGICRGLQVINVFLGGSLYQHIDNHRQKAARDVFTHSVKLCEGEMLQNILGEDGIEVNSFHHQVINCPAESLVCDAVSDEGYIEAAHAPNHRFLLGVQWHPECYFTKSETSSKIFKAFIEACKER
ncbi:MAG: gamma-glutamyl-gamma-aminobutyrate hydrolase family protein [Clostridia bacterium]|nr:gamma-glutamyl-gamma-aminobutyrate hydrolase family protein [Clostridia bacterium]